MNCPKCGAWTLVKETRKKPNNEKHRRYECGNLHRFSTIEKVYDSKTPLREKQKAVAAGRQP
jgi:transcriptional regulator NrdR family protein